MLLDEFTTKLLASCCKMTDLLAEGITGKCHHYWLWKLFLLCLGKFEVLINFS